MYPRRLIALGAASGAEPLDSWTVGGGPESTPNPKSLPELDTTASRLGVRIPFDQPEHLRALHQITEHVLDGSERRPQVIGDLLRQPVEIRKLRRSCSNCRHRRYVTVCTRRHGCFAGSVRQRCKSP